VPRPLAALSACRVAQLRLPVCIPVTRAAGCSGSYGRGADVQLHVGSHAELLPAARQRRASHHGRGLHVATAPCWRWLCTQPGRPRASGTEARFVAAADSFCLWPAALQLQRLACSRPPTVGALHAAPTLAALRLSRALETFCSMWGRPGALLCCIFLRAVTARRQRRWPLPPGLRSGWGPAPPRCVNGCYSVRRPCPPSTEHGVTRGRLLSGVSWPGGCVKYFIAAQSLD
jgi:hypothetical protein